MRRTAGRRALAAVAAVAAMVAACGPLPVAGAASPAPAVHMAAGDRAGVASRAQAWGAAEEQAFVDKINALRSSQGLAPLAVDPELTDQARLWAETMKEAGHIYHTSKLDQGITSNWQKLGENVGVGGTVDSLFDAFVASPKHYENLVDPVYRFVGVGVVWDGDHMYTTHRFMSLMPADPPTAPPQQPVASPRPAPKPAPKPAPTAPPATTPASEAPTTAPPTTAPTELAAAAPAPTAPAVAPAKPERLRLVLANLQGLHG